MKGSSLRNHFFLAFPITEFCKNVWPKPKAEEWWVSIFQNSDGEQLQWMTPWISRPPILFRCGNQSWVPLIGPWGMISYTPLIALGQFSAKQFIPVTIGLDLLELTYGWPEEAHLLSQMIQTWKHPHRMRLA